MPKRRKRISEKVAEKTRVRCVRYDKEHVEIHTTGALEFIQQDAPAEKDVTWLQVHGLSDSGVFEAIGEHFGIHPLVMEDVLSTDHRPKFEEYDDYLFLVFRIPVDTDGEVTFEQVSLLVGDCWLVSFMESARPLFDPVSDRIRSGKGRIRSMGPDYCAYALVDLIVDSYYDALEQMGDMIEELDERLVRRPDPQLLNEIHRLKRTLLYVHKACWPAREIIGSFERCDSKLRTAAVGPYLRDVYDHIIQVIDTVETYRDIVSGMLDTYLSSISYKLNEIMKVLTIISTIFIPLTFLAGVYGMNFDNMPETHWPNGYFMLWGLMLAIAGLMLVYFYKRGWLWHRR